LFLRAAWGSICPSFPVKVNPMRGLCNFAMVYGPVAGRILIAPLFLLSGFHKITGFPAVAATMAKAGMPATEALLIGAIVFELGGGLMVLLGWRARWGALMLAMFTVAATLMFHNFWAMEGAQYRGQLNHFMKNLAILGGLAYIMAMGSGPFSLGKERASESRH
jgi:putative oxidoreductase